MEAATPAASASPLTVAEPEMEADDDVVMDEPEEELEDKGESAPNEIKSRRPVLINDGDFIIDSDLAHTRLHLQVPYYSHIRDAHSVDTQLRAASYMPYMVITCMHKNWKANVRRLDMSYPRMKEQFQQNMRYDALGKGGEALSQIDPSTLISKDVTDEEVLHTQGAATTPETRTTSASSTNPDRTSCCRN